MPDAAPSNLVSETVVDAPIELAPPAAEPTPEPAPPTTSPPPRVTRTHRNLTTVAAISFSLTFVGLSLALLSGVLPHSIATLELGVDIGVVLLMVPVCALVLATLVEVLRTALRGLPRLRPPRPATILGSVPARALPLDWPAARRG
jgi:hypothetical protein